MNSEKQRFKTKAPFGVQSKRFGGACMHPLLDQNRAQNDLGPGSYNPKSIPCVHTPTTSMWKRQVDAEEFSRNLGFRNAAYLKEKKFWESSGGPGIYDIPGREKKCGVCPQGVGFGMSKRFGKASKFNVPPPGTYATGLRRAEELVRHRQFTPVPSFEWDGFVERYKIADSPWAKPPNLYNPKDEGSLKALSERLVSKRGPYDLFTGPRDDTTIKNHFARPQCKRVNDVFYTTPNDLDLLLRHPKNKGKGCFYKEQRFGIATQRHMINDPTQVKRDPDEPGPQTYNTFGNPEVKANIHPFNQGTTHCRPAIDWKILPGVGRYHPKYSKCRQSTKRSWVFMSKIGRPDYKGPSYNAF